jgi:phosphohistidine swiveling domain-containing protein
MCYRNYRWQVLSGEYNSPYLRNRLCTESFFKFPALLGISRPAFAIHSCGNRIEYMADISKWMMVHEELKAKVMADHRYLEAAIDKSIRYGEELNAWTEKIIFKQDLRRLSDQELVDLLKEFINRQEEEYAYGLVLPILDYQNFSFVEDHLRKYLQSNAPDKFEHYYALFTDPVDHSCAQEQEEKLLRLLTDFWGDETFRADLSEGIAGRVKQSCPAFWRRLSAHAKEYAWVYFVHMGPAFSEREFFDFAVDHARRGIHPGQKLAALGERRSDIARRKESAWRSLAPQGFDAFVLKIAGKIVWAKSRRKDHQTKAYYHAEKLLREFARRLFISVEHVRAAPIELIQRAVNGDDVDWSVVEDIREHHICLPNDDGSLTTLTGGAAEEFSRRYIIREEDADDAAHADELHGVIACPGKAIGTARIVNVPEDMGKMEHGDILVSEATTPSIVPALRKAAAIITDGGGLTCHAAIVSREFNIPCIVGLKIATKFAKDGDRLEIDAGNARVRKLA